MVLSVNERKISGMSSEPKPYTLLSHLPLFQGMSLSELDEVVSKVRFDFSKIKAGDDIVSDGQRVDKLLFIIKGNVAVSTVSDDRGYKFFEYLQVPCVLQPERLFGLTQRYSRSFRAEEECHVMAIDKADVMSLTSASEIFRLNVMNILCTMVQRSQRYPWHNKPADIHRKIFSFIENRCLRPAGKKILYIGMVRLAKEIGESRQNVSDELNAMHECGMIILQRGIITVPALEKLL